MATMHCEVLTPYRHFYAGEVESVLFVTHDGEIEILPAHEPMVASVGIGILRIRAEGIDRRAALSDGFVRVKTGRVDIFVDAAEWPEEVELERAQAALERAEKRLAEDTEAQAWQVAASRRAAARARNRIAVAAWASASPLEA
ncbi:MAG TPA: ATP synthase F1 subunit epsilon [Rectinemataceae bacterium]|nr:ATP synthase F1 subunit epsilon [Rectinemataceae bacterium]